MRAIGLWLGATALLASACSGSPEATTTTAAEPPPQETTSTAVATTQPVVTVDAAFAIDRVIFGEAGWIDVVNTGPQAGNIHGHWLAIHPFYLELPSAIVEVGGTVRITLGPDEAALVQATGLLPVLEAAGGEVGLYANGSFGDPGAIVDYVEWGSAGHFRSTVAAAAGIWDETMVLVTSGGEGGILVTGGPVVLDADLSPIPAG